MSMENKKCSRCKAIKDFGEFHKDRSRPDGLEYRCKACAAIHKRHKRLRHLEHYRAYDKKSYVRYRAKNLEKYRAREYAKDREHPERYKARQVVLRAIKSGKLIRPSTCEWCGSSSHRIEATHGDYSKPLIVIFLCSPCHSLRDGRTKWVDISAPTTVS